MVTDMGGVPGQERFLFAGGGARYPSWVRAVADALGVRESPAVTEAAPLLGAAMMARRNLS